MDIFCPNSHQYHSKLSRLVGMGSASQFFEAVLDLDSVTTVDDEVV